MKYRQNKFILIAVNLAVFLFTATFPGCGDTKVEVKDGCVTVTGLPADLKEITVTLSGPDEGWTKKGPVTGGKWGPYCFPRSFVGFTFNAGQITIDAIDTGNKEKTYKNKEGITLRSGDQDVPFDKFK